MIDKQTDETASLYVLDALDENEAALFEAQMQRSAALRDHVRELRDSLHTTMAGAIIRSSEDHAKLHATWQNIQRRLSASNSGESQLSKALPWSRIWAAAAILLFIFNLFLLRQIGATHDENASSPATASLDPAFPPQATSAASSDAVFRMAELQAEIQRMRVDLERNHDVIAQKDRTLQQLHSAYDQGRSQQALLAENYSRLMARFLPFYEGREGLSRFTVIEMVDARQPQGNTTRRPFAELAEQFLIGSETIVAADPSLFAGPVVEAAATKPSATGLAAISLSEAGRSHSELLGSGEATGFTVWRDDEQKGFLDIYNLPEPGPGHEAIVWARASDLEPYVLVGTLPPLENGSGSLFYSVEEPGFSPSEILVTAEDANAIGDQPNVGRILLRGP